MADDKSGRDKQADDERQRQRQRDMMEELERWDETEPPTDQASLEKLEAKLADLSFPAKGEEIVAAAGESTVEAVSESYRLEEIIPETDEATYASPTEVRVRATRPTVATSMKEILEASTTLRNAKLSGSQREAYEKTFRELKAIDTGEKDEGIQAIRDWILDRIHKKEQLPGSRDIRRQAAKWCRANGYQISNDEWLGV